MADRSHITLYSGGHRGAEEPAAERRFEPECRQLGCHERMKRAIHGATGQEVDAATAQLACARPGEHEPPVPVFLHQIMDDVEQCGGFLDLVDHDGPNALLGLRYVPQALRLG